MHILPPVRPEKSIERLTAILEPIAEKVHVVPRKRLTGYGRETADVPLSGRGVIPAAGLGWTGGSNRLRAAFVWYRRDDPAYPGHLLRAERESTILRLDADKAAELFRAEGVWEDVAALLSYHTAYLIFRDAQVLQQRTYSVIRNHLQEMILLPEETRLRTTILEYIQDRTLLSRSSILNVLSALKQGEYISFKRGGYLLEVRHLPESF